MMTLPLDAADRPEQVAGLVGMMLGIGYTAGALAPVAMGVLRDATGSFDASLWLIAARGRRASWSSARPARPRASRAASAPTDALERLGQAGRAQHEQRARRSPGLVQLQLELDGAARAREAQRRASSRRRRRSASGAPNGP